MFPDISPAPSTVATGSSNGHRNDDVMDRGNYVDYVRNWDTKMREAFEVANRNIGKSGNYNKAFYDRKRKQAGDLVIGDRVVVKNLRPKGTTRAGKLAGFWEPTIFEVLEKREGIPVYVVKEWGTNGNKTRTLHRNLLKEVNELAPVPDLVKTPGVHSSNPTAKGSRALPSSVPGAKGNPVVSKPSVRPKSKSSKPSKPLVHPKSKSQVSNCENSRLFSHGVESSDSESDSDVVVIRKKPPGLTRAKPVSRFPSLGGRGSGSVRDLPAIPEPENEVEVEVTESEAEVTESEVEVSEEEDIEIEIGEAEGEVVLSEYENDVVEERELIEELLGKERAEVGLVESSDELEETLNAEYAESDVSENAYYSVESGDLDESFHSTFNNSLDLEPNEEPPRRGTRERRPPKTFVYDVLGHPALKSRSKVLVHEDDTRKEKKRSRRPRK